MSNIVKINFMDCMLKVQDLIHNKSNCRILHYSLKIFLSRLNNFSYQVFVCTLIAK